MDIKFQFPDEQDIQDLLVNLSEEDRLEICAMGFEPEWGIRHSIETSLEVVSIRGDGNLACIVGVAQEGELVPLVYPWLLGTPFMQKFPRKVLKFSRQILNHFRSKHNYMENYVDARHERAIGWLTHLGAKLYPAEPYGPYGRPFHKFTFGEP